MHQIVFRLGLRYRPYWGAYSAPHTPSCFGEGGAPGKGTKEGKEKEEREVMGRKGRGGVEERKGKGEDEKGGKEKKREGKERRGAEDGCCLKLFRCPVVL